MKLFKSLAIILLTIFAFIGLKSLGLNLSDGLKTNTDKIISNVKDSFTSNDIEAVGVFEDGDVDIPITDFSDLFDDKKDISYTYLYDSDSDKDIIFENKKINSLSDPDDVAKDYVEKFIAFNSLDYAYEDFPEIHISIRDDFAHINFNGDVSFLGANDEKHFIQDLINTLVETKNIKGAYLYKQGCDYVSKNYTFSSSYDVMSDYSKHGMKEKEKQYDEKIESLRSDNKVKKVFSDSNVVMHFYNSNTKENVTEKYKVKKDMSEEELLNSYIELYELQNDFERTNKFIPTIKVYHTDDKIIFNFIETINTLTSEEEKMFLQNIANLMIENFDARHIYFMDKSNDYISEHYTFDNEFDICSKYSKNVLDK